MLHVLKRPRFFLLEIRLASSNCTKCSVHHYTLISCTFPDSWFSRDRQENHLAATSVYENVTRDIEMNINICHLISEGLASCVQADQFHHRVEPRGASVSLLVQARWSVSLRPTLFEENDSTLHTCILVVNVDLNEGRSGFRAFQRAQKVEPRSHH